MKYLVWLALAAVLVGCAPPTPEPTATATEPPTATPIQPPTLPPTWTPGEAPTASGDTATETPRPENTLRPGAPTLPPTWTPEPILTATPTFARQIFTFTPAPRRTEGFSVIVGTPIGGPPTINPAVTYPAACASFARLEPSTPSVFPGDSATLLWTPIEGVESFKVFLLSPTGRYTFEEVVTETQITIPAEKFDVTGPYGYEIVPLRNGDRYCQSLTGVIVARF